MFLPVFFQEGIEKLQVFHCIHNFNDKRQIVTPAEKNGNRTAVIPPDLPSVACIGALKNGSSPHCTSSAVKIFNSYNLTNFIRVTSFDPVIETLIT